MRGPMRTRIGAVAAAVAVALGALLGGSAMQPAPVAAAYCDEFPFLCATFTADPRGSGAGTITTADGFIDCHWNGSETSGTCSKRYIKDQQGQVNIAVTATAASGSYVCVFLACNSHAYTDNVTFAADMVFTASFPLADCSKVEPGWCYSLSFVMSGNGRGHVDTGDGLMSCTYLGSGLPNGGVCFHKYFIGPSGGLYPVHMTLTPNAGSLVCESNYCSDARTLDIELNGNVQLRFEFKLKTYAVTVARSGSGSGRILSSPSGIDCGSTCTKTFTHGDAVTLSAAADAGSTFGGWTGACAGQDATCDLAVTGASTNTATFLKAGASAPPGPTLPPGATPHPSTPGPTAGLGSSPDPATAGATPPASFDPGGSAIPGDSGTASQGGNPATGERGPDISLLVVTILGGAVIIAIGLAVGLRGRRSRGEDSASS